MTERFPFGPSTRPEPTTSLSPCKQRVFLDRPAAVQGAKRRSEPLDGEDRSEIMQGEGKGGPFPMSINRYIYIYLYCHKASSSAAKRLACQVWRRPLIEALEAGSPLPLRRHHGIGYFNK